MRAFLVLSPSLLLFLLRTPAQSLAEGMGFFNSDSPLGDPNLKSDMFSTSPSLWANQDLTINQDNNQADFPTWLGDNFGLEATSAGSQVMPLDIPDSSIPDHDTLESVCILNSVGSAIKVRQNLLPDWFPLPSWLSPPSAEEPKPGSDICIPPKVEEPNCKPGEETLCCTGKSNWIDDSMILVVMGCAKCTSPAIASCFFAPDSFLTQLGWHYPSWKDTGILDCNYDNGIKWCCQIFYAVRSLNLVPIPW